MSARADLDLAVPAGGDDQGVVDDRREAHAGHPLRVAVGLADGVLALAQRVPQLDCLVAGPRHDLCAAGNMFEEITQQALNITTMIYCSPVPAQ